MAKEGNTQQPASIKNKWYPPYIGAGLIIGGGTAFAKTLIGGELVLILVAIAAWLLYYPLKSKIKIKNGAMRVFVTFLILFIGAGMSVGFVGGLITGLANKYSSNTVNQESVAVCRGLCHFIEANNWSYGKYPPGDFRRYEGEMKYFQTQEQCLNYCLTQ